MQSVERYTKLNKELKWTRDQTDETASVIAISASVILLKH